MTKFIATQTKFDVGIFKEMGKQTRGYTQKEAVTTSLNLSYLDLKMGIQSGRLKLYYAITQISMTPNEFFNAFNGYKLDRMHFTIRLIISSYHYKKVLKIRRVDHQTSK